MTPHDEPGDPDRLLTPSEVAQMFRVNPKTVTRWARAGKLDAVRTLGGHRRFRASEIQRRLRELSTESAEAEGRGAGGPEARRPGTDDPRGHP